MQIIRVGSCNDEIHDLINRRFILPVSAHRYACPRVIEPTYPVPANFESWSEFSRGYLEKPRDDGDGEK